MDPDDEIAYDHIVALLSIKGIRASSAGSAKVRSIRVREEDAEKTKAILLDDAKLEKYTIKFLDGTSFSLRGTWLENQLSLRYEDILKRAEYSADTEIGALLRREGIGGYDIKNSAVKYPYVDTIRSLPRTYLSDGGDSKGSDVEIAMVSDLTGEGAKRILRFQVWESGRRIKFISCLGF